MKQSWIVNKDPGIFIFCNDHGKSLIYRKQDSEPLSATIASEPLTSTSEIQTDYSESFQLKVLILNYLQNQEISIIFSRILKLNLCSICQKVILKFQFQSLIVLDYKYLFHCLCLKRYIMQVETKSPTSPSHNIIIELTREETILVSEKYYLQKKQTDTKQDDKELMALLKLIEGGSYAG
ncbi:hypothetical protein GLOIN_2v1470034 [Rhizophagus clarus]|uniref:Uncharacterized protein n=1 Tax=Rhizophagus clarus TaxID=94130 RepID=A0A8H3M411_9GLOM|nr:hypothetical protein GLOIN_2v1470034 [Rhizophagus clarus]